MGGLLSFKQNQCQGRRSCRYRRQDWRSRIDRKFDRKPSSLRDPIGTFMEGMGRKSQSPKVDRCLKSCTKPIRELISNRSNLRLGPTFVSQVQHHSRSIRSHPGIGSRSFESNFPELDRRTSFVDASPDSLAQPRSMKRVSTIRMSQAGQVRLIIHIGPMSFDARHLCRSDFGFGMTA